MKNVCESGTELTPAKTVSVFFVTLSVLSS